MFSNLFIRIISVTIDSNSFSRVWGEVILKAPCMKNERQGRDLKF